MSKYEGSSGTTAQRAETGPNAAPGVREGDRDATSADIIYLTAAALAQEYRAGTLSPREATEAFLNRISAADGSTNAFCFVDADRALSEARASERRFADGEPLGPLDGVPIAIKDLLVVRGWPTWRGSKMLAAAQPSPDDAPSVSRLRERGAVFLGKTTTPEMGWKAVTDSPLTGISRNPWNTALSPGGSSGGSAAAVATGMAPLALGTDGGGSIRIPAALCGVVGFKPTYGLIPVWPTSPFGTLSHVGPMAWTVEDAALVLEAVAGPHPLDPTTIPRSLVDYSRIERRDLSGLRIAFSAGLGYAEVNPEVAGLVAASASLLRGLGADVLEVDPGFADPREAFEVLWYAGAYKAVRRFDRTQRADMDPGLVEIADIGAGYTASQYLAALETRSELSQLLDQFLQGYDLLVTPTLPILSITAGEEVPDGWPGHRWTSWTPFTYPFNMTGCPAASVPCGFSADGLPVGLQIVGPRYADGLVLGAAFAYEQAAPFKDRRRPEPTVASAFASDDHRARPRSSRIAPGLSDTTAARSQDAQDEVVDLLGELLRIDTTNSRHPERPAAEWVAAKLAEYGIDSQLIDAAPGRTSTIARIEGSDSQRAPLLIHAHLDVVPAEASEWTVDPFAGEIRDGYLWGRGAIDMKNMDAMVLAIVRGWARTGRRPPRDIVLAFVSDEESGGGEGSKFLVEHHPQLFAECTEAIGEVGGFSLSLDEATRLYLIQTAEKGLDWLRLRASGRPGHGSMLHRDNAVTRLSAAVSRIGTHEFPILVTETMRAFIDSISAITGMEFDPDNPQAWLDKLGGMARMIGAAVRNTANPTVLEAGYASNVIPSHAEATIDARFVPGQEAPMLAELDELLGDGVEREFLVRSIAVETSFDGALVDAMSAALRAEDPGGHVVPYLLSGGTDAKAFSTLGIRCFGFSPLLLPADLDFSSLFHGIDERVPIDGLRFGVRVLDRLLSSC